MSSKNYPLTCKDVKKILKKLGFEPRPNKGTSHDNGLEKVEDFFK
jgi:hypothetical protein